MNFRRRIAYLRPQIFNFSRNNSKTLPSVPCPHRFDRRIQRQQIDSWVGSHYNKIMLEKDTGIFKYGVNIK